MEPASSSRPKKSTNLLRKKIDDALKTDADLDGFCIHNFPEVFRRFSRGMERQEKLNLLFSLKSAEDIEPSLEEYAKVINHELNLPSQVDNKKPKKSWLKRIWQFLLSLFFIDYARRLSRDSKNTIKTFTSYALHILVSIIVLFAGVLGFRIGVNWKQNNPIIHVDPSPEPIVNEASELTDGSAQDKFSLLQIAPLSEQEKNLVGTGLPSFMSIPFNELPAEPSLPKKISNSNVEVPSIPNHPQIPAEQHISLFGKTSKKVLCGQFDMGSPDEEGGHNPDELQHHVEIRHAFMISQYEVTRYQYKYVTQAQNTETDADANLPIGDVTWLDAIAFCNRLSEIEGFEPCYEINGEKATWKNSFRCTGYRLPTEAEWEYAARANKPDTLFSGGSDLNTVGWYADNSDNEAHPVGRKRPNVWKLYDMTGNVREWVWDWYGAYSVDDFRDPIGPAKGFERVNRGGSYTATAPYDRVAVRYWLEPEKHLPYLGFRVVRSLPNVSCRYHFQASDAPAPPAADPVPPTPPPVP